ncbi:hypothetical protein ABKN59_000613 [Abortiporus biennis]
MRPGASLFYHSCIISRRPRTCFNLTVTCQCQYSWRNRYQNTLKSAVTPPGHHTDRLAAAVDIIEKRGFIERRIIVPYTWTDLIDVVQKLSMTSSTRLGTTTGSIWRTRILKRKASSSLFKRLDPGFGRFSFGAS